MPLLNSLPLWMYDGLNWLSEPYKENLWPKDLPEIEGVTERIEVIPGIDGSSSRIELHISSPSEELSEPVPCLLHYHGGGMVIMDPANECYRRWRWELASRGFVVVGVRFRNASGRHGREPYPAGLNDCVSTVCNTGESGGGNLSITSAMKAASEGVPVDGVHASCPFISNCYDESAPDYGKRFPSMVENEGYHLAFNHMSARLYTEVGTPGARDGFAWPIHATDEELRLLPKTIISVNECDPIRDEGVELAERMAKLGLDVQSKVVKGTLHATEVTLPTEVPELRNGMLDEIATFAKAL